MPTLFQLHDLIVDELVEEVIPGVILVAEVEVLLYQFLLVSFKVMDVVGDRLSWLLWNMILLFHLIFQNWHINALIDVVFVVGHFCSFSSERGADVRGPLGWMGVCGLLGHLWATQVVQVVLVLVSKLL